MGGQSHLFGLICQLLDVNEALLTIECFFCDCIVNSVLFVFKQFISCMWGTFNLL